MKWKFEIKKLSEIKPWSKNPRIITEKGLKQLSESINKFGLPEPLVINNDGTIIGGHARYQSLIKQDITEAICAISEKQLNEKQLEELNIRLNKNVAGTFDFDILANEFEIEELLDWGFDENDFDIEKDSNIENKLKNEVDIKESFEIIIECKNEFELKSTFEKMENEGYKCRVSIF